MEPSNIDRKKKRYMNGSFLILLILKNVLKFRLICLLITSIFVFRVFNGQPVEPETVRKLCSSQSKSSEDGTLLILTRISYIDDAKTNYAQSNVSNKRRKKLFIYYSVE